VHRISWWLEWPVGAIRVAVVFLVGVASVAALYRYVGVLRDSGRDASRNSALSYADREVAGGNGLVADQAAVYEARARIPEDETYRVVVSPDYQGGSDLTVPYVDSYYRYFLVPRRPAEDAQWLICYGCDLESYGGRAAVVWESSEDISIARLGR
jgi:hypothetical protein